MQVNNVSSSRLLIIPDLHHHIENAEHWIATQPFDRVVFLGDYFDDYHDSVSDARRTAFWLKQRMVTTQDIFLLGNHDAAYLFPETPELFCPGFTPAKAKGIHEILRPEHWQRFQLAHAEGDWLMSHAGFYPTWLESITIPNILARCETAMLLAARRKVDSMLHADKFCGPLWMDWDNLLPIRGIHQIVGHTPDDRVREKTTAYSQNRCLDVKNGMAAALLVDGKLTVLRR